jgi:hypothetical protein
VSTAPLSITRRAPAGSWSLIETPKADPAGRAQLVDRLAPVALVGPVVVPDVQLEQVDAVQPEVGEAPLGAGGHVGAGEDVLDRHAGLRRPGAVLGRDLGRDVDPLGALAHDLADQALAAPVAVGECGVDEVDPEVDRVVERLHRLVVVGTAPLAATDPPGAVADLRDLDAGLPKRAMVHAVRLPQDRGS